MKTIKNSGKNDNYTNGASNLMMGVTRKFPPQKYSSFMSALKLSNLNSASSDSKIHEEQTKILENKTDSIIVDGEIYIPTDSEQESKGSGSDSKESIDSLEANTDTSSDSDISEPRLSNDSKKSTDSAELSKDLQKLNLDTTHIQQLTKEEYIQQLAKEEQKLKYEKNFDEIKKIISKLNNIGNTSEHAEIKDKANTILAKFYFNYAKDNKEPIEMSDKSWHWTRALLFALKVSKDDLALDIVSLLVHKKLFIQFLDISISMIVTAGRTRTLNATWHAVCAHYNECIERNILIRKNQELAKTNKQLELQLDAIKQETGTVTIDTFFKKQDTMVPLNQGANEQKLTRVDENSLYREIIDVDKVPCELEQEEQKLKNEKNIDEIKKIISKINNIGKTSEHAEIKDKANTILAEFYFNYAKNNKEPIEMSDKSRNWKLALEFALKVSKDDLALDIVSLLVHKKLFIQFLAISVSMIVTAGRTRTLNATWHAVCARYNECKERNELIQKNQELAEENKQLWSQLNAIKKATGKVKRKRTDENKFDREVEIVRQVFTENSSVAVVNVDKSKKKQLTAV